MSIAVHSFSLPEFDPLRLYLHVCPQGPGLLESLNPLPKTGRYSIVPLRVRDSFVLERGRLFRIKGDRRQQLHGSPLQMLAGILAERSVDPTPLTPFPGGFFGYFGYDLVHQIEELPYNSHRDLPIPELYLDWVDLAAVYHHEKRQLTLASLDPEEDLQQLEQAVRASQRLGLEQPRVNVLQPPRATIAQADFEAMVRRAKDYIAAGDVYQANLSCRFDARVIATGVDLYRRLRAINPSPFACLLRYPGLEIISSSPERLVSLRGRLAETRPIAGTRPRGFTPPRDSQLEQELLAHPKERAEHIMLLDLERNDLGKVCRAGTVEVDELMVLERYSHVSHIVSNVRGELRDDRDPFSLLQATFPGGTITGVPKKRCMEIIDELEPLGRGSYTGSAGYLSATGEMDLNILIRSYQLLGQTLTYQVGAGIVADSIPQQEWQECLAKGAALQKALEE
ncbi:MAG: anthranilate synthase component I family protein [Desulfuromonadales bacterium]|jgi:para-aminobenzoate synthetase component 1|nr:anthranilate synthase component I family protein [Desulfuromonadales bacterium]